MFDIWASSLIILRKDSKKLQSWFFAPNHFYPMHQFIALFFFSRSNYAWNWASLTCVLNYMLNSIDSPDFASSLCCLLFLQKTMTSQPTYSNSCTWAFLGKRLVSCLACWFDAAFAMTCFFVLCAIVFFWAREFSQRHVCHLRTPAHKELRLVNLALFQGTENWNQGLTVSWITARQNDYWSPVMNGPPSQLTAMTVFFSMLWLGEEVGWRSGAI